MKNPIAPPKTDTEWIVRKLVNLHGGLANVSKLIASHNARTERDLAQIQEYVEAVSLDLLQGRPFPDHDEAFSEARNIVSNELTTKTAISIKVLAVSSSFSWNFYSSVLPAIFRSHTFATCDVDVLLVEPEYLTESRAGKNSLGDDWSEMSRSREDAAKRLISAMESKLRDRYRVSLRYYRNIPHWHGVLINSSHLLLGRTSWEMRDGVPNLRVGENTYRHFIQESEQGSERIALFLNWCDYYTQTGRKIELYPTNA